MKERILLLPALLLFFTTVSFSAPAQEDARVSARIDARRITVGDRAHVFLEVQHDPGKSKLQWAFIPDTFNRLEIVEKGKIDTVQNGNLAVYKQKLDITGFDSGLFTIPSFNFSVIPNQGVATTLASDSFVLEVQTVAVDTTQPFKPIKGILEVKRSWKDYLPWIIGGVLLLGLIVLALVYFLRRKAPQAPAQPAAPQETLQQKTLRLLAALEQEQLWQAGKVKEYYVGLTDIVRGYIEARFNTAAMELTTDELLAKANRHQPLLPFRSLLETILRTADLAKFAKAQPLPQEHTETMSLARKLVQDSAPVISNSENPQQP